MMSSDPSGKLPRPELRGLLHKSIKRNLILVTISITAATLYVKCVRNDERKRAYAEFYKNYDINKEFEAMKKKGLFRSC